jgi:hypothetical protein
MKNSQFNTGICEETHSKRVIVNALAGAKKHLGLAVLAVKGRTLQRQAFDGAVTVDGCLCLTGAEVGGFPLLDAGPRTSVGGDRARTLVSTAGPERPRETSIDFFSLLRAFLESAAVVRNLTGSLPRLFLNGVYAYARDAVDAGVSFTYLPPELAEFLASYLPEEKRRAVFWVAGGGFGGNTSRPGAVSSSERFPGERAFALSCARFVYRSFSGGAEPDASPVYHLGDRAPGFPLPLADIVWKAMHDRPVDLESFTRAFDLSQRTSPPSSAAGSPGRVPLLKRRGFIRARHSLGVLFASKWKLILLLLLAGGVIAYLLVDLTTGNGARDGVSNLDPRGVTELYYSAMTRLDLDVVQSLLHRKAGRRTMNELSTLYVMSKLGQVYGGRYADSAKAAPFSILSIRDMEMEQVAYGQAPVFRVRYKKTINGGDKKSEYLIEDALYLERIGDRWYIVKVESATLE